MELYERGILTLEETGGLDLRFGSHESMVALLHLMAHRQGFGDLLSDGVVAAARRIGKGTEKYAMHVKGLELPAYDVRGAKAHGLNYATSYTGADHNRGYAFQEIFGIPVPYGVNRFAHEVESGREDRHGRLSDYVCLHSRHGSAPHGKGEHRGSDGGRHRELIHP
jgi:aldehyde:ferredoxin oxidoreductase